MFVYNVYFTRQGETIKHCHGEAETKEDAMKQVTSIVLTHGGFDSFVVTVYPAR